MGLFGTNKFMAQITKSYSKNSVEIIPVDEIIYWKSGPKRNPLTIQEFCTPIYQTHIFKLALFSFPFFQEMKETVKYF